MPGDGELDLVGVLRVLARQGALRRVGPEVISPTMTAMDPVEAATLAGDRTRALVSDAFATAAAGKERA